MSKLRSFDVWLRKDATTSVRYRCFENLDMGSFCVQSADYYRQGMDQKEYEQLEKQFVDLLLEEDPFVRSGAFYSVQEAIASHDSTFE